MGLNLSIDYSFQYENRDMLRNTAKNILNKSNENSLEILNNKTV